MSTIENKSPAKTAFQLKSGLFHFMTIKPLTAEILMLEEQLSEQIAQAPNFFRNASLIIDLQQFNTNTTTDSSLATKPTLDLSAIATLLRHHGLFPVGILHATEDQKASGIKIGLAPLSNNSSTARPTNQYSHGNDKTEKTRTLQTIAPLQSNALSTENQRINADSESNGITKNHISGNASSSKLITAPIRSGQQFYVADGDLIITSTVSNGAEILADGNIHIYGALRGRALAGINGNCDARIFCQSLEAELISIAGQFKISEDFAQEYWKAAVEISLHDGKLQIKRI